jgi:hypothetical protein
MQTLYMLACPQRIHQRRSGDISEFEKNKKKI